MKMLRYSYDVITNDKRMSFSLTKTNKYAEHIQ